MSRTTKLVARFAGRDRIFCLRIGEIEQLETLCNAGVGAIYSRLATLQFRFADIRETIRLGLIGGGMIESEAEYWVGSMIDDKPLKSYIPLAIDILAALLEGFADAQKEAAAEDAGSKKA